jgi:beta-glucosidase/6-phospho-beta-glucosidase/beta-galactosidase
VINNLLSSGIEPIITIYHTKNTPMWFTKIGSFEKKDNIKFLVLYAQFLVNEYTRVKNWFTFYEPNVYAIEGFLLGISHPFKKNVTLAAEVLHNLADAHVAVYHSIKSTSKKIGIIFGMNLYHPYDHSSAFDRYAASILSYNHWKSMFEFFVSGHLQFYQPLVINYNYVNYTAIDSFDMVAITYSTLNKVKFYSNLEMFAVVEKSHNEGLYYAVEEISLLNIPIFIITSSIQQDFMEDILLSIHHGSAVTGWLIATD